MITSFTAVETLAAHIGDGARLALPSENSGVPVAIVRALIARGAKNLRLVGGPTGGFAIDLLVGAGCVASVEAAGVSLGPRGLAPRFCAAVEAGEIEMIDSTCPATHAGYLAGEKRLPFMAVRGVFGSSMLEHRTDWTILENPFPPNDPVVVVGAILPDAIALHAPFADEAGNVWVGNRRELKTMARASARVLVSVEEIRPGNMVKDASMAPGLLTVPYIDAIAVARKGAAPTALPPLYASDEAMLEGYARAAKTRDGFDNWLSEFLTAEGPSS
jgi:glutaconate CoA-transferase, subunit A